MPAAQMRLAAEPDQPSYYAARLAALAEENRELRAENAGAWTLVNDLRADRKLLQAERDAAVGLAGLPRHLVEAIARSVLGDTSCPPPVAVAGTAPILWSSCRLGNVRCWS